MNNPTVKLDLDSIINFDLVYEQNLPVLYSCLLSSIVFASLFLPFTIAFLIAFNQKNSLNRQTANAKKSDKGRGSKSTNHRTYIDLSLTMVFSKRSGPLQTVCLGLNFRTRPSLRSCPLPIIPKKKRLIAG